jgi:hypothetical protein
VWLWVVSNNHGISNVETSGSSRGVSMHEYIHRPTCICVCTTYNAVSRPLIFIWKNFMQRKMKARNKLTIPKTINIVVYNVIIPCNLVRRVAVSEARTTSVFGVRCHNPEDHIINIHRCDNLKSHKPKIRSLRSHCIHNRTRCTLNFCGLFYDISSIRTI